MSKFSNIGSNPEDVKEEQNENKAIDKVVKPSEPSFKPSSSEQSIDTTPKKSISDVNSNLIKLYLGAVELPELAGFDKNFIKNEILKLL